MRKLLRKVFIDRWGDIRVGWWIALWGVILFVVVAGLVWGLNSVVSAYDERQCTRYGKSTGREVKFIKFSSWSWDCFVRTSDGKWVLKSQVRDVSD